MVVVYEQGNLVERIKRNRVKIRRTKPNEDEMRGSVEVRIMNMRNEVMKDLTEHVT